MLSIRSLSRIIVSILLLTLSGLMCAYSPGSSQPQGIGLMATSMLEPINMLRQLMNAASIIVGIYLLISAFTRYLRFRQNPQESPIGTVFFWAILGVILIAIPLAYHFAMMAAAHTGMNDVF